jgi:hypothetical protein
MRKCLITPTPKNVRARGEGWLDVERAAVVEVTSEDNDFPFEGAYVFSFLRLAQKVVQQACRFQLLRQMLRTYSTNYAG